MARILITGANGTIGREIAKHLNDAHHLTLVDLNFSEFPKDLQDRAKLLTRDLTQAESWDGLLDEVDYVIQLAGEADQDAKYYDKLRQLNYDLPHNLFEQATKAPNLKRIIFASSIHAVDAYPNCEQVKVTDPVRPSNLYGVSKVYLEGLASFHAYQNGIQSIGIRIADYRADNTLSDQADEYGRAMYFSKDDMNRLIDRCIQAEFDDPFLIVNGVSANTFPRLSNESARLKLGYEPQDNGFDL